MNFHGEFVTHVVRVHTGHQAVLCAEDCVAEKRPEWKPESGGQEEQHASVCRQEVEAEKQRDHQGKGAMLTHDAESRAGFTKS